MSLLALHSSQLAIWSRDDPRGATRSCETVREYRCSFSSIKFSIGWEWTNISTCHGDGCTAQDQVWAYDVRDLLLVKQGTLATWEPRPYGLWHMPELDMVTGENAADLRSAGDDPETRR